MKRYGVVVALSMLALSACDTRPEVAVVQPPPAAETVILEDRVPDRLVVPPGSRVIERQRVIR